ncbi:hypothetical protein ABIG06_005486 [Bradyrhizobium sp. USDA 326]|uniref:hypothetical protein n=1 Tax=unclassified Bradyrhizobium TaxID=2631580 RepID=UPI0035144623
MPLYAKRGLIERCFSKLELVQTRRKALQMDGCEITLPSSLQLGADRGNYPGLLSSEA